MFKAPCRARFVERIRKSVRTLGADTGGFAAVEFAMVMPIMVAMLLGCVEVSDALSVDKRINVTAGSIGDMVARTTPITKKDITDIFRIGNVLLGKYPAQNMYSEVVSMEPDAAGVMKVVWSLSNNGSSPYPAGSVYPGNWDNMVGANNSLIVAKTKYTYVSPIGQFIHGPLTLSHVSSYVSRTAAVRCTNC